MHTPNTSNSQRVFIVHECIQPIHTWLLWKLFTNFIAKLIRHNHCILHTENQTRPPSVLTIRLVCIHGSMESLWSRHVVALQEYSRASWLIGSDGINQSCQKSVSAHPVCVNIYRFWCALLLTWSKVYIDQMQRKSRYVWSNIQQFLHNFGSHRLCS